MKQSKMMSLLWGNEVNIEIYVETIEILNEINTRQNETEKDDEPAVREWSGYWNIGRDEWNIKRNEYRGEWNRAMMMKLLWGNEVVNEI